MPKFNKSAKRQELNKLSEAKIIKQCKKYNIKIYKLSKKEMIDKLLIKFETKHNEKQVSKAIVKEQIKVTVIEHYAMIIHALARENNIDPLQFPNDIAGLIAQYIELIRIFDSCSDEFKYAIQNYGTFINRKQHKSEHPNSDLKLKVCTPILFGVSNGFKRGERDNIFKVKLYQNNKNDSIGIISRIECCNRKWPEMDRLGRYRGRKFKRGPRGPECYRYYLLKNAIFHNSTGLKPRRQTQKIYEDIAEEFPKRKPGDVIMMKVDMDKWFIRFYINDKLFGYKIKMIEQDVYYPIIHTKSSGKYRVLM